MLHTPYLGWHASQRTFTSACHGQKGTTAHVVAGINAAGEHAPIGQAAVPVNTWQGPVQVTEAPRVPVSAFAEQLLAEPEAEPTGVHCVSACSACWTFIELI